MPNSVNLDISTRLDITCRKGDTFLLSITVKDSAGALKDISGYTFLMQVRPSDTDTATPILAIVPTGTSGGVLTATTTATLMAGVASGMYVYDLQATIGGSVHTWFHGLFVVNEDIAI